MNIWKKLLTAVRGAANEIGEAVVDGQALRILDQEIRDAYQDLERSKESLARVLAEEMGMQRKIKELQAKIEEHEGHAAKALEKGNEALALDVAKKIAELSDDLEAHKKLLEAYTSNVTQLKQTISETERNIRTLQREVSVVKTTEVAQKVNAAIAAKFSGTDSSLRSATDSLERIKAKQQKRADEMKAAMQLRNESTGETLQEKLKAAGIINSSASAHDILDRIKAGA